MVETNTQPLSAWWPNIADPMRRLGARVADYFSPASDAAATDNAYIVEVELPGVKEEDITIEQHGNMLLLKGHKNASREEEGKNYYFSERTYGAFSRTFRLPADAEDASIEASVKDGVLTLHIPKRKEAEASKRQIPIGKK
ncbi:MAG: Hsp20/alpha crystallin family protein [Rhodospirillaceae bacterium]|jgi:HSP20 family protein|nr:Hsp20/alpha crystallin family protein [Rhodospirillaceae bacterium]MBT4687558.1 Hsp20/alpha crystallin family protein [Rhodospirillaceae bacterium]MBT5080639.1 Hsp20/alpha crystallin family protein [Rhodospirillaceae bacterium]MBT5525067.1 Hsp20/alpha crystallin family protein [Rhodospirillaceae bacterium]MBT5878037.1 Hsp20/alpha crystallin family protein [Rhodospirillaceae bacterium]